MVQRDPHEWLGLLRWSSKYHDGTRASELRPLSAEDRAFLEAALSAVVEADPVGRMGDIVDALVKLSSSTDVPNADDVDTLFDELQDFVEDLNYSRDLHKIQKFGPLVSLLSSPHANIRARAASTLGTATQNDQTTQDIALSLSCLEILTHLSALDPDRTVRQNALFALSCIIRNHPETETRFVREGDGFRLLTNHMDASESANMRRRALFLTDHLLRMDATRAELIPFADFFSNLLDIVASNLSADPDSDAHDCALLELALQVTNSLGRNPLPCVRDALHEHKVAAALTQAKDTTAKKHSKEIQNELDAALTSITAPLTAAQEQAQQPQPQPQSIPHFEPTLEWKEILPGQHIPPGLHVRCDFETGKNYAKVNIPDAHDPGNHDTNQDPNLGAIVVVDNTGDAVTTDHDN